MKIPEKWRSGLYTPELKVFMVDPHDLKTERGELQGISAFTTTDGYYSNTKISGSLTTVADNYIGGSWLRFKVDGEEVATLGVQNLSNMQIPEKAEKRTYALQSTLWMLDEDIAYTLFTIAAKTKASTTLKAVAKTCQKEIILQPGMKDSWSNTPKVYERTDSFRSIMADVCSRSGNQLSVDGHGRLSVAPYVEPKSKEITWTIDADDPRGIVIDPGYTDDDKTGEAYNRTVVISEGEVSKSVTTKDKKGKSTTKNVTEKRTIVAHSDAAATEPISSAYRGWTRTKVHQVSDMSPFTQAKANNLVNQYLADDRSRGRTRTCSCLYWPVKGGEAIEWVQNGKSKKYLVQTVDADYIRWTVNLTLKEI